MSDYGSDARVSASIGAVTGGGRPGLGTAGAPWFLGETMSALDIYLAVMTHWRPRWPWFSEHCPRVAAIAVRADAEPSLAEVWRSNFPDGRTGPE